MDMQTYQVLEVIPSMGGIEVPLTQGKVALIDRADSHLLAYSWSYDASTGYPQRAPRSDEIGGPIRMHEDIMPPREGFEVDHRDGNRLNNRRENLRYATHSQNGLNTAIRDNNTSGFRGVSYCSERGNWEAYITVAGQRKNLGRFSSKFEAAAARATAEPEPILRDLNDFQAHCLRTVASGDDRLMNAVLGIAGEAGEIVEHFKKARFHGHKLDLEKLLKEDGDVLYYVSMLAAELGYTLSEVAEANVAKLRARYPEGTFSAERSMHRAVGDV